MELLNLNSEDVEKSINSAKTKTKHQVKYKLAILIMLAILLSLEILRVFVGRFNTDSFTKVLKAIRPFYSNETQANQNML